MSNFNSDLKVGELGVRQACAVLRRYGALRRVEDDKELQKRGIDVISGHFGTVEVKTNSYPPDRVFFELSSNGGPGAIDRSIADYLCIYFYKHSTMLLIDRSYLVKFLREHGASLHEVEVKSRRGKNDWTSLGVLVETKFLIRTISPHITQLSWNEEEEVFSGKELERN